MALQVDRLDVQWELAASFGSSAVAAAITNPAVSHDNIPPSWRSFLSCFQLPVEVSCCFRVRKEQAATTFDGPVSLSTRFSSTPNAFVHEKVSRIILKAPSNCLPDLRSAKVCLSVRHTIILHLQINVEGMPIVIVLTSLVVH